jgi:hypothetical protein
VIIFRKLTDQEEHVGAVAGRCGHLDSAVSWAEGLIHSTVRHATVSMATRRGTCHVSGRHGTVAIYS